MHGINDSEIGRLSRPARWWDDMLDRFTPSGREAVTLARAEATRLGHNYLGTEHLLLGVLRAEEGRGARVLTKRGFTLDQMRAQVVEIVGPRAKPDDNEQPAEMPSTPRVMDVLVLAWQEARSENNIASEHILLALVREGKGAAAHILSNAGVTAGQLRSELGHW